MDARRKGMLALVYRHHGLAGCPHCTYNLGQAYRSYTLNPSQPFSRDMTITTGEMN